MQCNHRFVLHVRNTGHCEPVVRHVLSLLGSLPPVVEIPSREPGPPVCSVPPAVHANMTFQGLPPVDSLHGRPAHWASDGSKQQELVTLDRTSPEFAAIETELRRTLPANAILRIERNEHAGLWREFCGMHHSVAVNDGVPSANAVHMWHGTRPENLKPILSRGFDPGRCTEDVLFGSGVYFASAAAYSHTYSWGSSRQAGEPHVLLFCRVIRGSVTEAARRGRIRPLSGPLADIAEEHWGFEQPDAAHDHSCFTRGGCASGEHNIIVSHRAMAYPEYAVWYH